MNNSQTGQGAPWKDIVQGEVTKDSKIGELVGREGKILKALADMVDDHDMKISHVIRDE